MVKKSSRPETQGTDWTAGLATIDVGTLRPVYDELAGHENDAGRQWVGDRRHVRRTDKAVMLDARRLADALEHIGRLPEPGEAYHLVTAKRYSLWHVVKATLHLAAPATIGRLTVATLGFSRQNLEELLDLLDRRQIGKVDFLFSVYFESGQREICERLAHELATRGQRVVACLQHAKVVLLEMSDGRAFVVESSANLRSCASIEQLFLTQDRALLDFHRAWIDDLLTEPKR
jgi:hypothetical protein